MKKLVEVLSVKVFPGISKDDKEIIVLDLSNSRYLLTKADAARLSDMLDRVAN